MFGCWKNRGRWMSVNSVDVDWDNLTAENFISLVEKLNCDNTSVSGEKLLKYIVENQRRDLFRILSLENIIRLAYDNVIHGTGNLSGAEYLAKDHTKCAAEQLMLLRKAAGYKDQLYVLDYDKFYLYEMAIFEICRRNDAELLKIYLDDFAGICPDGIYDTVFDYYIYMYLPEWDLLEQYNQQNDSAGDLPGIYSNGKERVSGEIQQHLLDVLIRQAEKCNIQSPDVLQILLQHNIPSVRGEFPVKKQDVGLGMEFSSRDTYDTGCASRLLLHYERKNLVSKNCIDPWDLNDMLTDSGCAFPVTCSCGFAMCTGIDTLAESWVFGNHARLYIPMKERVCYLNIDDRRAFKDELLLMLRHIIRTLECHTKWQQDGIAPADHNNDDCDDDDEKYAAFLPHGTTLRSLQQLCEKIAGKNLTEVKNV